MEIPKELEKGNVNFVESGFDFSKIAKGQHAKFVVITCSDARVSPEVVFNQPLDTLFVIRNAGAIMAKEEMATLQYAIEHIPTIEGVVYMSHTSCGMINAVLSKEEFKGDLGSVVDELRAQLRGKSERQALEFMTRNSIDEIKKLVAESKKSTPVFGVIYHTDSGKMERIV
ncbi:MAG: carbonic anhydrase [Candidatus Micrarchaeia archaeon]